MDTIKAKPVAMPRVPPGLGVIEPTAARGAILDADYDAHGRVTAPRGAILVAWLGEHENPEGYWATDDEDAFLAALRAHVVSMGSAITDDVEADVAHRVKLGLGLAVGGYMDAIAVETVGAEEQYFALFDSPSDAMEFEGSCLGSEDLTPEAAAVLAGDDDPPASYWAWLISQVRELAELAGTETVIDGAGPELTDEPEFDVDAVIKDVGLTVATAEQWLDIGLACLEQADVSLRDLDRIVAIIQGRL